MLRMCFVLNFFKSCGNVIDFNEANEYGSITDIKIWNITLFCMERIINFKMWELVK